MTLFARGLERIDDGLNPILVKELRQAVKNRVVIGILGFFLVVQLLILVIGITTYTTEQSLWSGGNQVFLSQQMLLLFTLTIALPFYSGSRMLAESTDPGGDLMFLITLRPSSIILGKLLASLTIGLLIFSVCAPFMTLAYLLRGIDLLAIFVVLLFDLILMVLTNQFAVFIALVPGGLATKRLAAAGGGILLLFFGYILSRFISNWIVMGFTNSFFLIASFIPLLAFSGFFYFYSIALISPPSSNSMVGLRVYMTLMIPVLWAILALAMGIWPGIIGTAIPPGPMVPNFFSIPIVATCLCPLMVFSTCEREHCGPRILRNIPAWPLFRPFAFLFSSGSAGGFLHTVLLIPATLGLALSFQFVPGFSKPIIPFNLSPLIILILYTYCFSLMGFIFRCWFLSKKIKPENTWIITLAILILLSVIPNFSSYLILGRISGRDEAVLWNLTNPFFYFFVYNQRFSNRWENDNELILLLGLWGAGVTILALPFWRAQFRQFVPMRPIPKKKQIQPNPD